MGAFELILEEESAELRGRARLWQHKVCGAQLLSFCNADENKVFGVALRTPPPDSSGLPHILEHSVLCGSEKYPLREPFVELLKGSLQTFLNAFTYPDKTCYPVASANTRDFYNLVDVYLDAVFHPRLEEHVFQQEGWHLDAGQGLDEEPSFSFKGVVYNEMKGAFSAPESVLERHSLRALFPDTPYSLESGGDPEVIPELSFAAFRDFHRRFYHPSNARFFFWGDDPEEKRLEILSELLAPYAFCPEARPELPLQPAFSAPRSLCLPYAAGKGDKALFTLNWALPGAGLKPEEVELSLGLAMLDHALLGMPASPLRRALLESGLGEDLAGNGLNQELHQAIFSIGLKGMEEGKAAEAQALILRVLEDLACGGLPEAAAEAAVNSVEFALRENNTGSFPAGLSVWLRSLSAWLYSDDPADGAALAPLRFEAPLRAIKARQGGAYFAGLIQRFFLDNPHRASVLLRPDVRLAGKQALAERRRLQAKLAGLSAADKAALTEASARLKRLQSTPDSPEVLACLPRLAVNDLPRQGKEIAQERRDGSASVYFHPQPTGGVSYLELRLEAGDLPVGSLPLLPMLGRAMLEMGNKRRDRVELNMEIARKTGGMEAELDIFARLSDGRPLPCLRLSGKSAPDKIAHLFNLSAELLKETDLDKPEQFRRMLLEEKARLEYGLVPAGHLAVARRLRSCLSPCGYLAEESGGIGYLERIRALRLQVEEDWPALLRALEETRSLLLARGRASFSLTAEQDLLPALLSGAEALALALPQQERVPEADYTARRRPALPEALLIPARVNYVGLGMNLYAAGYVYHGSAQVILKYLRAGWLWEQVRMLGGAYGAMAGLDRASGDLFMVSYRDPNIGATLQCFRACAERLTRLTPDRGELEAAIVGAVGELDAHLLPEAKGREAYRRAVIGDTEEGRARLREQLLGTTAEDFRRFGLVLEAALPQAVLAAMGGAELKAHAQAKGWSITRLL